jgi:ankyrin repeat protein
MAMADCNRTLSGAGSTAATIQRQQEMADSSGSLPERPGLDPKAAETFVRTVRAGDLGGLRRLLETESSARSLVNAPIFDFDSPALVAVAGSARLDLVELLLEFGADPNRRSDWWAGGFHTLHHASAAVADRLIAAGAELDACAAAHLDRLDDLARILHADPDRVRERGGDGQTPLHFARSRDAVDLLLDRGADIDARDVDHRSTPAEWMLDGGRSNGRMELARYLVERGAAADVFLAAALGLTDRLESLVREDPAVLRLRTGQGRYGEQPPSSFHIYTWSIGQNFSPLQVAAHFGQTAALALLARNATERERFLLACAAADAEEAERLLAANPRLVSQLTADEHRALPDAAWADRPDAVALMLRLGFDAAARGQDGGTVLHCAAWRGSVRCIREALRWPAVRALIEERDPSHHSTPLGWCCHGARYSRNPAGNYPEAARLLLAAGASVGPNLEDAPPELRKVLVGSNREGGSAASPRPSQTPGSA